MAKHFEEFRATQETVQEKKVTEISKGLAGRYLKKVPASAAHAGDMTGTGGMGQVGASDGVKKGYEKQRQKGIKKFVNRHKGTSMAVDKLTGKAKVPAREEKELKGDQHKLDHDKDGDIDGKDFKALRDKKKKFMKKKGDGDTAEMNPKLDNDKKSEEQKESTDIRSRLLSIWEDAAGEKRKKDQNRDEQPTDRNASAKKMKDGHGTPDINDTDEKGHDDAAAAGRAGPSKKARSNDQDGGDKKPQMKKEDVNNNIMAAYKSMSEK